MLYNALVVLTAKPADMIIEQGGTGDWALSPGSMRDVEYVVCARNSDRHFDEEFGPRFETHGEAFLVGKVSGLKQVKNENNRKRYLVQITEYARLSTPDLWGKGRNPALYTNTDELRRKGIDLDKLNWLPMPETNNKHGAKSQSTESAPSISNGLTIAEAKLGLSIMFGVPEDAIQIVING